MIAFCCILLSSSTTPAGKLALPTGDFVSGWEKTGPELRFTAGDLYGHINGGAELFLEFGFSDLRVQSYASGEDELALELYHMRDPAAALGIYLMKCGRETPDDGLSLRHTVNRYQLSLVRDEYFALVNNFRGKRGLVPVMLALAAQLGEALPTDKTPRLFDVLAERDRVPGSERIIRGPYGLEPVFTFGPGDILGLGGEVAAVLADYRGAQGESFTRIVVDYPYRQDALGAFTRLREELDPSLSILEEHEGWFSFRDRWYRYGVVDLRSDQLNLKIGLTEPPSLEDDR